VPASFVALSPFFSLRGPTHYVMEPDPENRLNPEDELKDENELLKLKLELEHGMKHNDTSSLSPEVENEWLNYVYAFEQQYKDAKRIKVFDALGRPAYKKADDLKPGEVAKELDRLLSIMGKKGIALDYLDGYDEAVIYQFITDELFNQEVDDISIPGMVNHFIYEEFHPNHAHDMERYVREFAEKLYSKKWNPEYDTLNFSSQVRFNGNTYDKAGISSIIEAFQEAHLLLQLEKFELEELNFDKDKGYGNLKVRIAWTASSPDGVSHQKGYGLLNFSYDNELGYWDISEFQMPGLGG
jgi:hypothetical protein